MPAGLPTVRIVRRIWLTTALNYAEFRAVAVVTFAVGLPEEVVFGNRDGAGCNREVGGPEEELFGKQDVAGCYRAYGESEENMVRKQDGAVRIRNRVRPQECQPCEVVDENDGIPPVS